MKQQYLRDRFNYDPTTGLLIWKTQENHPVWWNRKYGGKPAGHLSKDHVIVGLDKKFYKAHRLIWLLVYGEWPPCGIDHIDRNKQNNRIGNLRLGSVSENAANAKRRSDNTTGYKGVSTLRGKFRAQIRHMKRFIHLGLFDTAEEAHAAYCGAARVLFGKYACFG